MLRVVELIAAWFTQLHKTARKNTVFFQVVFFSFFGSICVRLYPLAPCTHSLGWEGLFLGGIDAKHRPHSEVDRRSSHRPKEASVAPGAPFVAFLLLAAPNLLAMASKSG